MEKLNRVYMYHAINVNLKRKIVVKIGLRGC